MTGLETEKYLTSVTRVPGPSWVSFYILYWHLFANESWYRLQAWLHHNSTPHGLLLQTIGLLSGGSNVNKEPQFYLICPDLAKICPQISKRSDTESQTCQKRSSNTQIVDTDLTIFGLQIPIFADTYRNSRAKTIHGSTHVLRRDNWAWQKYLFYL